MRNISITAHNIPIPPKSMKGILQPLNDPIEGMSAKKPEMQLQITIPAYKAVW